MPTAKNQIMSSLALPGTLLMMILAGLAVQLGGVPLPPLPTGTPLASPPTTIIPAHRYSYRAAGEFLVAGKPADAPMVTADGEELAIMTYQVSAADYARCVDDGVCKKAEPRRRGEGNVPVTGVSFRDASAYAEWLSRQTGGTWRLPTVAEWHFAAGTKAVDPALGVETDSANPAERWIAFYEKQAALGDAALATPQQLGSFGVNEYGIADLSEVVWEWTATCGGRTSTDANGAVLSVVDACGERYLEGRHRTALSIFVRDAVSGGCSIGIPPDNLGFRLVRERPWYEAFMLR